MDKIRAFTPNCFKGTHYACNEPSRSTLRRLASRHALFSSGMITDYRGRSLIIGDDARSTGSSISARIADELRYMKTGLKALPCLKIKGV